MKRLFTYASTMAIGFVVMAFPSLSHAAVPNDYIGVDLKPPENTECRLVDFSPTGDTKRNFNGTNGSNDEFYDLCIGSFPQYPSTGVEGGVEPFYYAKYRFFPDPMPIYTVSTSNNTGLGYNVDGINQSFVMDTALETQTVQYNDLSSSEQNLYDDLFLNYPYDSAHQGTSPVANANITGPYQIGYNSFYHNTYRARYFASEVEFDFRVLEPKKGSYDYATNTDDKTVLFAGVVYYELPDSCFREDVLDYTDECREIEFYFPKSDSINAAGKNYDTLNRSSAWNGEVKNEISVDKKSRNVLPEDRLPYNNPGEHLLVFEAKENTQLRVQKDIGTEYQTIGNESNSQNQNPTTGALAYFKRVDKNIDGSTITPIMDRSLIGTSKSLQWGDGGNNDFTVDSSDLSGGNYVFDHSKNEDFINYCDTDTGVWGEETTDYREDTNGRTDRGNQIDTRCYHDEDSKHHFWITKWSNVEWYAENPRN